MATTDLKPVRWGILGPGSIAHRFCSDVQPLAGENIVLAAVGSRDQGKADEFADKYGIARRHASYEALVADDTVDVVYVATPHPFHQEQALMALRASKAVLCEKPFTVNATQAEPVIAEARARGVFLMEGMWSRFFPAMVKARELVSAGAIGEVRMLQADFGFRTDVNPQGRLFNPALAGGGLLDVGVYPVSLASQFLGGATRIASLANLGTTGVDEEAAYLLGGDNGSLALLSSAIRVNTPHEALLLGTSGSLKIESPWWKADKLTLKAGGKTEEFAYPFEGGGFQFEARHVAECLRAGKTESDVLPLSETLAVMHTLDALRAQFGLKYPLE